MTIRPALRSDAGDLAALFAAQREHLAPWDPRREPASSRARDSARGWRRVERDRAAGNAYRFLILEGGELAGEVSITNVVLRSFQSANLGYWVAGERCGRGVATAAVAAICEFAFGELELHRLEAGTLLHNVGSQIVLDRNGFVPFGVAPDYLRIAGAWCDHVLFQRTAEQAAKPLGQGGSGAQDRVSCGPAVALLIEAFLEPILQRNCRIVLKSRRFSAMVRGGRHDAPFLCQTYSAASTSSNATAWNTWRAAICALQERATARSASRWRRPDELEPALARLHVAREALASGNRPGDVAICDHCLGIVLARLGREHEALQRLEQARSAYAALHRYLAVADCEEHIGYALLALDRRGAAVEHLSHARALHDEAGRTDHVAACEAGLSAASGQRERPRPALDLPRVAPPLRARLSG